MINTVYYLYTRATRKVRTEISRYTTLDVWSARRPTKFLIHGFLDMTNKQWWIDLKNAILDVVRSYKEYCYYPAIFSVIQEDVNVIMVDWPNGNGFPYEKASANTQVVGAEVALFINYFISQYGSKAADFHVIGHSLGAHVAGYVGERVAGLGRISGRYL